MAPPVAPSSDLKLTMGDIERKVDMSLDDIIKQSKGKARKQHRFKVKNENRISSVPQMQQSQVEQPQVQQRREFQQRRELQQRREVQQRRGPQQRRDVLQRFVAMRSSAIRQGKLAESRARNGNFKFVATKTAARQALSSNVSAPVNRWSRKPVQGTIRPVGVAARNTKLLVFNQWTKTGASRRPAAWWTAPLGKGVAAQPRRQTWGSNKMLGNSSGRKLQTLDSRFASLREERQLQSQFGPHAGWRR